jgi:hypothetical protein
MTEEIASSPVLTGLALQVRSRGGQFYRERPLGGGDSAGVEAWLEKRKWHQWGS